MGKRIDDFSNLDDTPIASSPTPSVDVRDEAWFQFIDEIDDLLASDQYRFAEDTLRGIRETVERTHWITDGQRRAVTNISHSTRDGYSAGTRRRYEGFRRGGR